MTQDVINENDIKYIIAILPDKKIYDIQVDVVCDHAVMKYIGYNMEIDISAFDKQCILIEKYRKEHGNILVFCNNGYPFLCYYLLKYHHNEVPDMKSSIDIILPQVDLDSTLQVQYIKDMTLLLEKFLI